MPSLETDDEPPPQPAAQGPHSEERHYRRLARAERGADLADETLADAAALDLVRAVATLTTMLAELFADVGSADFRDPSVGVRPRFEDWRRRYPDEFGKAFGALAMVGVWEFWARAEMGVWNPFAVRPVALRDRVYRSSVEQIPQWEASPASLESYAWHSSLAAFSHVDEPAPAPGVHVDDTDAVCALVESAVVPQLQNLAVDGYDPYSATATKAALALVEEVSFCVDRNGQKFEVRPA
jgi:GC-rich sequence DNA-binding factor